jgi:hypothetical protein
MRVIAKYNNARTVLMSLGEWFGKCLLAIATTASIANAAKEVEKVSYADEIQSSGSKLVLNGAGLRTVKRFGMTFRVYTGGLYLTKKNSDAKAVIASDENKELRMHFLRSVDKETLRDSMIEAYGKDCGTTCKETDDKIKAFVPVMLDSKDGSDLVIRFTKSGVEAEMTNPKKGEPSKVKIESAPFSHNLLAVFIGEHPPTEEFKKALLGQ